LKVKELSPRVVILAIILTLILATANAFLALKLGLLTSASIPAAILSMGILKFFKNSNIWENNLVQTAASAGEAVAGGIVYTIPALVIIGYWQDFSYWQNFCLALLSGWLGVLFSIPLRKTLVNHPGLPFPEGRAIAAILQNQANEKGFRWLLVGLFLGALIDFLQTGMHVLSAQAGTWVMFSNHLFYLSIGFSVAMLSAGFLIGPKMSISILLGVLLAWFMFLPYYGQGLAVEMGPALWNEQLRYLGIGALLMAGLISLLVLLRPLLEKIFLIYSKKTVATFKPDQGQDIPKVLICALVAILSVACLMFLDKILPISILNLAPHHLMLALMFVLGIGFILAVISGYFSAMVGVSASPGSSVVISALLIAAWGVLALCRQQCFLDQQKLLAAQALVIILASMVTGIAAIANDNIQDLKVGQMIGASPWRQQVMLMLGVLVASLVIPAVMQILFKVYGIAGHGGKNALPAPTAVLLATLTQGFFQNIIPWHKILLGMTTILGFSVVFYFIPRIKMLGLSIFGIAIGMYLPQETSIPLIIGGGLAGLVQWKQTKGQIPSGSFDLAICVACGLVAGSAVMDVILAFVFAFLNNVNGLALVDVAWQKYSIILSISLLVALWAWVGCLNRQDKVGRQ
jgi:putative OPT family oligopeptide transporter